jgi:hypothetical protein
MLIECKEDRRPLSLTISHPARRVMNSPLALTMAESKVELLPTLLSTTEYSVGRCGGSQMRVSISFKSFSLMKERG